MAYYDSLHILAKRSNARIAENSNATSFSNVYNPPLTNLWFSGETLFLNWYDTGLPGDERMSITVGSTTVGHRLW